MRIDSNYYLNFSKIILISYFDLYFFKSVVMMINPMNKSITEYAELIIITNKTKTSSLISLFIALLGYKIFVDFVFYFS